MNFDLDHIGIAVSSLQESIALYESAIGWQAGIPEQVGTQGVSLAMLSGSKPQAAKLELLEADDSASALGIFVRKSGTGLHHLAFRVDNLEEAMEQLQIRGFQIVGKPQAGADQSRCIFVHPRSTGGVLLELIQRESTVKE